MGDRTRLFMTGIAAAGAIAVTVAAPPPWTWFDDDRPPQVMVPLSSLKDFDGITLHASDDVVVTKGDKFEVVLDGDQNAQRYLNLYVKDGVLHVDRRGHPWNGQVTVRVTMPNLTRFWLAGSGDAQIEQVDGKSLSAMLTGSGDLQVDNIVAENVAVTVRGSGDVVMAGTTDALEVNVFGSGDMSMEHLDAKSANIVIRGSGTVQAHSSGVARIDITGSGDAQVTGTTNCQISKNGSGDAECTS
ncbi:MAG TPA: head GIN domain-containing protein [Sphingobium sp.]